VHRIFHALPSESGLEKRVRAQLDLGVANELTVSAVAMVVQHGDVKVLDAAGLADRESQRPMRTDAIFEIRSMSKPITMLGALLLVQEGKPKLNSPLSTISPEFSHLHIAGEDVPTTAPITVQQLMTHTSGVAAHVRRSLKHHSHMPACLPQSLACHRIGTPSPSLLRKNSRLTFGRLPSNDDTATLCTRRMAILPD
jgi:CubicO group peptidase (beta-lactamase class C family)